MLTNHTLPSQVKYQDNDLHDQIKYHVISLNSPVSQRDSSQPTRLESVHTTRVNKYDKKVCVPACTRLGVDSSPDVVR